MVTENAAIVAGPIVTMGRLNISHIKFNFTISQNLDIKRYNAPSGLKKLI